MQLSPEQQEATDKFLDFLLDSTKNEMVIEGYPGCGKSFLTKHLIEVARNQSSLLGLISDSYGKTNIMSTATTNKAAAVLHSFIKEPTETIHKTMSLKVSEDHKTGAVSLKQTRDDIKFIKNTLIIVDEAGYVDSNLLKIIRRNTFNCKVLYIGDRYQLSSFKEPECPIFTEIPLNVKLKGSKRFTADGPIAQLAAGFRKAVDTGKFPQIVPDGKVIQHVTGPELQAMVEADYTRPDFEPNDSKIIAWSNTTVEAYNKHIRKLHTNSDAFVIGEAVVTNKPIRHNSQTFFQTEEMAIITDVQTDTRHGLDGYFIELNNQIRVFQPKSQKEVKNLLNAEAIIAKPQNSWGKYFNMKNSFADLRATHACTVYKAQGSTYNTVYINLTDIGKCHQPAVTARMLHVAVTRAANKVVLYGELPAKYRG